MDSIKRLPYVPSPKMKFFNDNQIMVFQHPGNLPSISPNKYFAGNLKETLTKWECRTKTLDSYVGFIRVGFMVS